MTKNIAAKIADLIFPVNEIVPNICAGGCGVFAALLTEKLSQLGFDAKAVELVSTANDEYDETQFFNECNTLHNIVLNKETPTHSKFKIADHFMTSVNGFYFDNTIVCYSPNDWVCLQDVFPFHILGSIPVNELHYISIDNRGTNVWNNTYDPKHNSQLAEFINKALDELKEC